MKVVQIILAAFFLAVVSADTLTTDVFFSADPYAGGVGDFVEQGVATATLTRNDDGLGLFLTTKLLPKGTYTLWWIIFNDPTKCTNASGNSLGQCDESDTINPQVSTLLRAGGDVVDESGELTMVSWISSGSTYGEKDAQVLTGGYFGGLSNPHSAEVQFLLVWHGDPLPLGDGTSMDSLEAQLHDLQGGCQFYRLNGGMDPSPIVFDDLMGGPFEACPAMQGGVFASPVSVSQTRNAKTETKVEMEDMFLVGVSDVVEPGEAMATLTRNNDGLGLFINTKHLPKGTYTAWWIIYNDPRKCENGSGNNDPRKCENGSGNSRGRCGGADMVNPKVSALLRAGGDVVDESGDLTMVSWISNGSAFGEDEAQILTGGYFGALTDPMTAEVHVALVWHGDPLPLGDGTNMDTLEAQIHDLQGGCQFYRINGGMDPSPIVTERWGEPFEACPGIQAVVFSASEEPSTSAASSLMTIPALFFGLALTMFMS